MKSPETYNKKIQMDVINVIMINAEITKREKNMNHLQE
jgi:hypothetical protein